MSDCDIQKCSKRHPRECRYWTEYKRCKFGDYCSFKHTSKRPTISDTEDIDMELEDLKSKLESINKLLEVKDKQIEEHSKQIKTFEN